MPNVMYTAQPTSNELDVHRVSHKIGSLCEPFTNRDYLQKKGIWEQSNTCG